MNNNCNNKYLRLKQFNINIIEINQIILINKFVIFKDHLLKLNKQILVLNKVHLNNTEKIELKVLK